MYSMYYINLFLSIFRKCVTKNPEPGSTSKAKVNKYCPAIDSRVHFLIDRTEKSHSQCRLRQQSLRDADPAAHPEAASLRRPRGGRRPDLRGCLAGKVPRVFYVVGKMSAS